LWLHDNTPSMAKKRPKKPPYLISLHELTDQDTLIPFSWEDEWVREALVQLDEGTPSGTRRGEGEISLSILEGIVIMKGHVVADLFFMCSRCGISFRHETEGSFMGLYCEDPSVAGVGYLIEDRRKRLRPAGHRAGVARHQHIEEQDLDITFLAAPEVHLGVLLAEHLRLKISLAPLCQEACKGACFHCGANWNEGRCACEKLQKLGPFDQLKGHFQKKKH
jgi:uncharacterized metal-binding protein YceD (DUF177 family)